MLSGMFLGFYMRPRYSMNYSPNKSLVNFENTGYLSLRKTFFGKFKDFLYFGIGQFRERMFSPIDKVSTFDAISDILLLGSRYEMIRIYAFRVVALMSDYLSFWYSSFEYLIRKTRCLYKFTANLHHGSPISGYSSSPNPTSWSPFNLTHEADSIFGGHHMMMILK